MTHSSSPERDLPRPLAGITVLDLTVALAGPFATALLAGLGARVIKIEGPDTLDSSRNNAPYLGAEGVKLVRDRADDISISALNRLRNKQAISLNLKHPRAAEVLSDLVRKSDVLVENFSRGTLERLGFGYPFAKAINPRLVYASITGYGHDSLGPAKAMDSIIQALSGVMHVSGSPNDPPTRIGLPIADLITPLFGIVGVLSALHLVQRIGEGQHVDVSMLGTLTSLMAGEGFDLMETMGIPLRTGPTVARLTPFGIFPARSGEVAICAPTDTFATGLFRAMGQAELANDPRFATRDARVEHATALDARIGEWTRAHDIQPLIELLQAQGVPAAAVRGPREAVRDPRVLARHECVPLEHPVHGATAEVYGMGVPIRFSAARAEFDRPPPAPGEHNQEVYADLLGYSDSQIAELRTLGVI